MTTITIPRALLEQALNVLNSFELQDGRLWYSKLEPEQIDVTCSVIRAALTKPDENGGKTGWPPGMLQDDDSKLSKWLSRRGNAGQLAAQAAHQAALAAPATAPSHTEEEVQELLDMPSRYHCQLMSERDVERLVRKILRVPAP